MQTADLVTVVVPARNEERFIQKCVQSIQDQDYKELQIIVVDGASDDGTVNIVKRCAEIDSRVELLINPDRIIPTSLNQALRAARGRWLVRVDAHASVPPDYVRKCVEHLKTGRWGGVGGRKTGIGTTSAGHAVAAVMASRFGVGNSTYHYGDKVQSVEHVPFGAYPVFVARELGGWDETLRVNQDFEFDYRVRESGRELLFDPELNIAWHCRQSVPDLYRQYVRYGRGKVSVAWKHPSSMRVRHLMAPVLVAELGLAAAVALRRPIWGAALVAPYATALAVATLVTAKDLEVREARKYVAPAFAAMHIGWGVGFWSGVGQLARRALHDRRRAGISGRNRSA